MSGSNIGSLSAGMYIKLDGEAYEVESVDSSVGTFTLVEVCRVVPLLLVLLVLSPNL